MWICVIRKVIQAGDPAAPLTTEMVPRGDGDTLAKDGEIKARILPHVKKPLLSVPISWVFQGSPNKLAG